MLFRFFIRFRFILLLWFKATNQLCDMDLWKMEEEMMMWMTFVIMIYFFTIRQNMFLWLVLVMLRMSRIIY